MRALYVEGAHPGLADAPARRQRLRHDRAWAQRFAGEPLAPLRRLTLPFGYLCGAQDAKFSALAEQARLPWWPIPAVGHNAHHGNPQAFAARLLSLLAPFE